MLLIHSDPLIHTALQLVRVTGPLFNVLAILKELVDAVQVATDDSTTPGVLKPSVLQLLVQVMFS